MASRARAHPDNAPGPWFVDTTCIDCDVVRFVAPAIFADSEKDGLSYVKRQPKTEAEELAAARGLLACPTGSVGGPIQKELVERAYPWPISDGAPVSMLGYTSPDSFGAMSYLVERSEGNVMVDSPRWNGHLERAIEARGGLAWIFLTHRDDVADAGRYAKRFGAKVAIQELDARTAPNDVEVVTFAHELAIAPGVLAFHTPGHTRGHAMLLVDDTYLFTGDSLHWSRKRDDLGAWEGVAWYSWEEQIESLARLAKERSFEWVLPGHGNRGHAPREEMQRRLEALVKRMREGTEPGEW